MAVAVAEVDQDVRPLGDALDLGPGGVRAVDLVHRRAVGPSLGREALGPIDVAGRLAVGGADDDDDLLAGGIHRGGGRGHAADREQGPKGQDEDRTKRPVAG
jgi:hypothetical protein